MPAAGPHLSPSSSMEVFHRLRRVCPLRDFLCCTMTVMPPFPPIRKGRPPGPPSKGERYFVRSRLPMPVAEAVWKIHFETGATISDIIANLAANALGMPEHAPHIDKRPELPLKTA